MPASTKKSPSECFELLGVERISEMLSRPFEELVARYAQGEGTDEIVFLETCFGRRFDAIASSEWELFRKWHASTSEDENLEAIFCSLERQVEECVELFFMDLASASETCSGDYFNEDTHDSFYWAAREVNGLGTRTQLEFLRDNAPTDYQRMLRAAGLKFILPRRVRT